MLFEIKKMKDAMDAVRENSAYAPERSNGVLTTKCNLAVFRLVQDLGFVFFWTEANNRIMLANEMMDFMDGHPETFSKFQKHQTAWELANKGYLILAAKKAEEHGHIAPVYPSSGLVISGKWMTAVPYLSNVGIKNAVIGANFAFGDIPGYYLVI